jgi:protein TonB
VNAALALLIAIGIAVLIAACSIAPTSPPPAASRGRQAAPDAAGEAVPPSVALPTTPKPPSPLDLYKQSAARHIVVKNRPRTFEDVPEHFLRSIVVLRIVVDSRGTVKTVFVDRGNGYTSLEKVAVKAVRDSSPLPAPPPQLVRTGSLEYSESFLFRKDNRFQIRSIALEQPDPDAPPPVKRAAGTQATAAPAQATPAKKR